MQLFFIPPSAKLSGKILGKVRIEIRQRQEGFKMTYQEMVDALAGMDEKKRQAIIKKHWQVVLSDGFVAFVQGQIEAGRKMAQPDSNLKTVLTGLIGDAVREQMRKNLENLLNVWNSMATCYQTMQRQSERQGNSKGMVAHGKHTAMPRGVSVSKAARCYRCGSTAVDQGLCNGCLATQQDWERDDLDYDRQHYQRQQDDLDYQRIQDDQIYNSNQYDYNTYTDYNS
jgi:hypothetical protein